MGRKIEEIETELFDYLKASNYSTYIQTFNLYLGLTPTTDATLRLKVLSLLYYMAIRDTESYNMLIQTIRADELEDEMVQFTLRVEEHVMKHDMSSLKKAAQSCGPELGGIMEILLENLAKENAEIMQLTKVEAGSEEVARENHLQNIKDCIFVAKSFPPVE